MEGFTYWLGQAFGIFALLCCFIMPLFRKKWQMLVLTALGNLFFALNYIAIGEIRTGMVANVGLCILLLVLKTEEYNIWLELLPLVAAAFNTLATFERDEQKTRILTLINAGTYFAYYAVLGMSSMFAELLAAVTCVIGLIRYRKK